MHRKMKKKSLHKHGMTTIDKEQVGAPLHKILQASVGWDPPQMPLAPLLSSMGYQVPGSEGCAHDSNEGKDAHVPKRWNECQQQADAAKENSIIPAVQTAAWGSCWQATKALHVSPQMV